MQRLEMERLSEGRQRVIEIDTWIEGDEGEK